MSFTSSKNRRTSKFIREYGMTLMQMANKYEVNKSYIWILHQRNELHQFIEEQEKKEAGAKCK
jgi:hypothetical protein